MPHLTAGQLIAVAPMFIAAELGAIGYAGLKFAAQRATDVRIICYLLSLVSLSTYIGATWAQTAGGIDSKGRLSRSAWCRDQLIPEIHA